jgi:DNA-binding NarL/FixJ family response regulator
LRGRQRLRDGDRIRVGRTVLVYRSPIPFIVGASTAKGGQLSSEIMLTDSQRRVLVALCRPYSDHAGIATPASNQQIADEVFLSVDTVKMHLRALFQLFHMGELPQNQKRARLAEQALNLGIVTDRDLA